MFERDRLDRQLRIPGWDQNALEEAPIGVVGDREQLTSLFLLSAAALGIRRAVVVAPELDSRLMAIARRVNPRFQPLHLEGYWSHWIWDDLFRDCRLVIDFSRYALAGKLLLESAFRSARPLLCVRVDGRPGAAGFRVFSYERGREWQELNEVLSPDQLPGEPADDPVLDLIVAGLVLEEAAGILMGRPSSERLLGFRTPGGGAARSARSLVVGAGALGTLVGLGLALSGLGSAVFLDPDRIEPSNLNRQVLFYQACGENKAETLAARLTFWFGMEARGEPKAFDESTNLEGYDLVFDCLDNFPARVGLSAACRRAGCRLISGGTSAAAGQMICYDPLWGGPTPAELLGLEDLVRRRAPAAGANPDSAVGVAGAAAGREASCSHRPEPSVVMTNQIIAGFMVDAARRMLVGDRPGNVFYAVEGGDRPGSAGASFTVDSED